MFFIKKKRCKYCASVLVDGKCTNSNCINYDTKIEDKTRIKTTKINEEE